MSFSTIFIISFLTGLTYFLRRFLGDCQLERPLVLGPVVGLVLGDFRTGLEVGASLELVFMGAQAIGGSVPSNVAIGSALGTAIAITSKTGLEGAMMVAVPVAVVASTFEMFAKTFCAFSVHLADKYAEKGDWKGISLMVHAGNAFHFLAYFIPTLLALYLGAQYVTDLMNAVPANIMSGIKAVGSLLPALGFGLLLNNLSTKEFMPYFFIGFAIAAYIPSFGVMGIAFLGTAYVALYAFRRLNQEEEA
ncbi:MAG: PTS sugar transporter subunit IIC [Lachnospiraceae bacterium]|uniref:PTS mannose/fructose/sorbose/N-acetylgalactosamine transporter subunit IIC n=1 Tax=Candidatus Merdisoma sp. JLR.KK011 TaxID=3114299 RepID=UPI0029D80BD7|nr:PTS sugar transporter subunit IIC [Lachnospiraceae bacterium]MCI9382759.1 PTS sugar transporter subunit IIC [Lachnospiraceae bacterium]MCI9623576.1 PTS sugar transporter subunit IIC [Lachnospiraceae bacterium]